MKLIPLLLILLSCTLSSCSQSYHHPDAVIIKAIKIGDQVDTNDYTKYEDLHFPTHLDGWDLDNSSQLPDALYGLPIAIWQSKADSNLALSLLGGTILNITVSGMKDAEKEKMQSFFTDKFGAKAKIIKYEQAHPLQSWITYWQLITWEGDSAIAQIGTSEMRKPNQPASQEVWWDMVYSDLKLENEIINAYKRKLFSNKQDSTRYAIGLAKYNNEKYPPANGTFTSYYDNGQKKEKGNYINSKKDGLWETWYENGQKEDSATYKNDLLVSQRLMWHSNGQLQLESYWGKDEHRVGIWKRYFKNGNPESIGGFDNNGEFHGIDIQFYENGVKKRETHYEHGRQLSDQMWSEKGTKIGG